MPIRIRSSNLTSSSLSSSLYSIVYFKDSKHKIKDLSTEPKNDGFVECEVFFKPDRIGPQEKYIQVKLKEKTRLELDVTIRGNVCLLP